MCAFQLVELLVPGFSCVVFLVLHWHNVSLEVTTTSEQTEPLMTNQCQDRSCPAWEDLNMKQTTQATKQPAKTSIKQQKVHARDH
jgi:hypothetical protein